MTTSPVAQPLATRTLVRGTSAVFETVFVEADGTPLVPSDPSLYPSVSITDGEGTIVDSGIGVSLGGGRWRYQFMIPGDAVLSTDVNPWRIDWLMVTSGGRQAQLGQNFAVIDSFELTPTDRAYTTLVMLGQSERLVVKFRQPQSDVSLILVDQGGEVANLTGSINYTVLDGWHIYYVDTPIWTTVGHYTAMWTTRASLVSPTQTLVTAIRVPEPAFWFLQPSLRMLIDKVQKKSGHVQSYSDSDMYEYMLRGVDVINATGPVITSWTLNTIYGMSPLQAYLVAAAAWWGLQAQYISEGDLAFAFSGQTVTLDVDRTGYYDSALSKLNDFIQQSLPTTKKGLLRQSHVGVVGTRPYSFRHGPFLGKLASGRSGGGDNLFPLGKLGLLV